VTAPIRVVWLTLNPIAIARGYWDQGCLEDLFSGALWPVGGDYEWEHVELVCPDDATLRAETGPGAVLIVPARHHARDPELMRLMRAVRRMLWCVLVLCGDEEGEFPVERFRNVPRLRSWVMTPQAGREYGDAYLIGSGYPPGIREAFAGLDVPERSLPWAFMGQVTHERRAACVDMLHDRDDRDQAWLVETPGFTQGLSQEDYWRHLAEAKIAPCPSGPVSPDSFRVYEALEAGAVPLADNRRPGERPQHPYWERVFGALPFPVVEGDWAAESQTIDWLLDAWPANANRTFAWWQRQKRRIAYRLREDVAYATGQSYGALMPDPAAAVTAVVTSSPTPKHPDTADLEATLASIRERLPGAEIVLVFDGVNPELEHRREAYDEYVRRALWLANTEWSGVVPLVCDEWLHQANATRRALDEVRTRHVLFAEHDTPLTGDIDWQGIIATLDGEYLDVVRLHHETAIGEHHQHMMLDQAPVPDWPTPIIRTYQWSQRPHVAATAYYRSLLRHTFAPEARCMIEDVMHGVVATAWREYGPAGWARFRLGIYAPEGNVQRSLHLDSRRLVLGEESTADPKGAQLFAYPSRPPDGAPAPGMR
jgi:hypothetical protein